MSKPFFTDAQREFLNKCSVHIKDLTAAENHLPAGVKRDEASFAQLSAAWEKSKGTVRPIHLNHEAQKRHAELAAMIVQAGGPTPPAAPAFQTSPEWDTTFSAMESQILELHAAEDRRRAALKATGSRIDAVQAKKEAEAKATQARYDAWIAGQIPSRPAGAALPAGTPTKFKNNTDAEVIATLKNFGPKADKDAAAVEMQNRGFHVDRGAERVFMSRSKFDALSERKKSEAMRSGFSLRDDGPVAAKSTDLVFPSQPKHSTRTAAQLLSMSPAAHAAFLAKCDDEDRGGDARAELVDAMDSFGRLSWRHHEAQELTDKQRQDFVVKFMPALTSVRKYGPRAATVNDPAPAASSNAMTAAQFLALPAPAATQMNLEISRYRETHRGSRAELKRAYTAASAAEKTAMLAIYGDALKAFPQEYV